MALFHFLGVTRGFDPIETGSSIEKLLGNLIPARGLRFSSINLQRPRELASAGTHAPLTAWIFLTNAPRTMDHNYPIGFKSISSNSSGRRFENKPEMQNFHNSGNGFLMAFPLSAFPRDEPTFRLAISPSPLSWETDERYWAEFEIKNPFRPAPVHWNASPLPITNHVNGQEFVLRELRPHKGPSFSIERPAFHFTFKRPSPDWHLISCSITDGEGNTYSKTGWGGRTNDPTLNVTFNHSLETNRPWKVTAWFAAGGSNLFNPGPLAPTDHHFLQLAVNGPEVSFTNKAGILIRSRLSLRLLHVRTETRTERPYFVLLGASNQLDTPV